MREFKPCRLSVDGETYEIDKDRSVWHVTPIGQRTPVGFGAQRIIAEAYRLRRNRANRERHAALRSLGLVKTPYGWE